MVGTWLKPALDYPRSFLTASAPSLLSPLPNPLQICQSFLFQSPSVPLPCSETSNTSHCFQGPSWPSLLLPTIPHPACAPCPLPSVSSSFLALFASPLHCAVLWTDSDSVFLHLCSFCSVFPPHEMFLLCVPASQIPTWAYTQTQAHLHAPVQPTMCPLWLSHGTQVFGQIQSRRCWEDTFQVRITFKSVDFE